MSLEICNGSVSCGGAHHNILSSENNDFHVATWRCLSTDFDAAGASPVFRNARICVAATMSSKMSKSK